MKIQISKKKLQLFHDEKENGTLENKALIQTLQNLENDLRRKYNDLQNENIELKKAQESEILKIDSLKNIYHVPILSHIDSFENQLQSVKDIIDNNISLQKDLEYRQEEIKQIKYQQQLHQQESQKKVYSLELENNEKKNSITILEDKIIRNELEIKEKINRENDLNDEINSLKKSLNTKLNKQLMLKSQELLHSEEKNRNTLEQLKQSEININLLRIELEEMKSEKPEELISLVEDINIAPITVIYDKTDESHIPKKISEVVDNISSKHSDKSLTEDNDKKYESLTQDLNIEIQEKEKLKKKIKILNETIMQLRNPRIYKNVYNGYTSFISEQILDTSKKL